MMYSGKKIKTIISRIINSRFLLYVAIIICSSYLIPLQAANQHPALPANDGLEHQGVANCTASMCHGSVTEYTDSAIARNEYIIYSHQDAHSRSWRTLFSNRALSIAQKLQLQAPHEEKICLDCHVSNIAEQHRSAKFQLSDGINCEACHGGAEHWLSEHTEPNQTHLDNIAVGLYPSEDPVHRARLCMSCHLGNLDKYVTHAIMGAGHPRLSFELMTFSVLQPPHHQADTDYKKRKPAHTNLNFWVIGQLVAVEHILKKIASNHFNAAGLFPELSLFDCHACHQSLSQSDWKSRHGAKLSPGTVRLNDANFVITRAILSAVNQQAGATFYQRTLTLHHATTQDYSKTLAAANKMLTLLTPMLTKFNHYIFKEDEIVAIIRALIQEGLKQEYRDYINAEQFGMSIVILFNEMDSAQLKKAVKPDIDALFDLLQSEDTYDKDAITKILTSLEKLLG